MLFVLRLFVWKINKLLFFAEHKRCINVRSFFGVCKSMKPLSFRLLLLLCERVSRETQPGRTNQQMSKNHHGCYNAATLVLFFSLVHKQSKLTELSFELSISSFFTAHRHKPNKYLARIWWTNVVDRSVETVIPRDSFVKLAKTKSVQFARLAEASRNARFFAIRYSIWHIRFYLFLIFKPNKRR